MKKLVAIFLAVSIFFGLSACSYYNETYKKETSYAVIPTEIPEKEKTIDANGEEVPKYFSYKYTLTFVTDDGKKEEREYAQSGENPVPFEPGSYVTAEISKKRIVEGPTQVDKSKIPEKVLEILNTLK